MKPRFWSPLPAACSCLQLTAAHTDYARNIASPVQPVNLATLGTRDEPASSTPDEAAQPFDSPPLQRLTLIA
jgi:hypothetical protein